MELKHDMESSLRWFNILLIVPYGIETEKAGLTATSIVSFNRTLWN